MMIGYSRLGALAAAVAMMADLQPNWKPRPPADEPDIAKTGLTRHSRQRKRWLQRRARKIERMNRK